MTTSDYARQSDAGSAEVGGPINTDAAPASGNGGRRAGTTGASPAGSSAARMPPLLSRLSSHFDGFVHALATVGRQSAADLGAFIDAKAPTPPPSQQQMQQQFGSAGTAGKGKLGLLKAMPMEARVSASLLPGELQAIVTTPVYARAPSAAVMSIDDEDLADAQISGGGGTLLTSQHDKLAKAGDSARMSSIALQSYKEAVRQASVRTLDGGDRGPGSKLIRRGNTSTNVLLGAQSAEIIRLPDDQLQHLQLTGADAAKVPAPSTRGAKWMANVKGISPGLPLMLLNTLLGCITSLAAKLLTSWPTPYQTFELIFVRSIIVVSLASTWLAVRGPRNGIIDLFFGPKGSRLLLFLRSFFGFLSVATYYVSVRHLSASEAIVLSFTSPIFVGIAGRVFLKENWEKIDAAAAVISLFGVAIIAKPDLLPMFAQAKYTPRAVLKATIAAVAAVANTVANMEQQRLICIAWGIASALSGSAVYIVLRTLRNVQPVQILNTFGLFSLIFALLGAWIFDGSITRVAAVIPSSWQELILLVPMMSLAGLVAQVCLSKALQYEKPSKCTTINSMQIVFSFVIELVFRGIYPRPTDMIGGGIIVLSVGLVGFAKWRKEKRDAELARIPAAAAGNATAVGAASAGVPGPAPVMSQKPSNAGGQAYQVLKTIESMGDDTSPTGSREFIVRKPVRSS